MYILYAIFIDIFVVCEFLVYFMKLWNLVGFFKQLTSVNILEVDVAHTHLKHFHWCKYSISVSKDNAVQDPLVISFVHYVYSDTTTTWPTVLITSLLRKSILSNLGADTFYGKVYKNHSVSTRLFFTTCPRKVLFLLYVLGVKSCLPRSS